MKIAIIGQGGHSKVIHDIISSNAEYQVIGYLDDKYENITFSENHYFAPIVYAKQLIKSISNIKFVIAIGDNKIRKKIADELGLSFGYYATLIHNSAIVSPSVWIGCGTVIMANTVINAGAQIGNHTIINTCSVIEHDNKIGNFVHISPNATLTGTVQIEDGVHIGAGATMIPNVCIGEWSVIGAGATVIKDIPSDCTAVGTPAKIKIKKFT
jgi:acetyltransferase EpsM